MKHQSLPRRSGRRSAGRGNSPVYSGKQIVSGDFLILSPNRSFLLRKRMIEVSMKNLLLQMESKSMKSLSWYSRARLKHSWSPASAHTRCMAVRSSAEYGSVSSIRVTTSHTSLASAWTNTCRKGTAVIYGRLETMHGEGNEVKGRGGSRAQREGKKEGGRERGREGGRSQCIAGRDALRRTEAERNTATARADNT
ncbi:hypothetical protein EYF80_002176 [Liparis tanakae]|uniref:Uncharacterized protein n=1 Tax=Liparis tanakae TaxID=230148 RepID=A0A4Z2JB67_9TELE|nr:hypothetical protein EYF80_002176 [Liparis tanakae]